MRESRARSFVVGAGLALVAAVPTSARERAVAPVVGRGPCPSQGPGFVAVPGTTTCLRLSGRGAAGLAANGAGPAAPLAAGRLAIDTRTATAYGPVRAFVRMGAGRAGRGP